MSTKLDKVFDCIIIGAGIIGTTIAHYLSRKTPDWQIAILDRSLIGGGASNYSAGLHIPYGICSEIQKLSKESEKEYNILQHSVDLPLYNIPLVGIVSKNKYNEQCSRLNHKPTKKVLKKDFLPKKIGSVNLSIRETIFQVDGCHYANVYGFISHIIRNLRINTKVKVWEAINITNISDDNKLISITFQDGRVIQSKYIVLAPGPWVKDKVFTPILAPFNIKTKKIVALHIDIAPTLGDPALFFFDHDAFLLPLYERGHWLFSYTCQEWDVFPSSSLSITANDRGDALKILKKYYPDLAKYCVSGRVFCDAYSDNRIPIISKVPSNPKIIFAGAASGSGYRLAPGIANRAISLILSK
jgi:D-arginine dehydrogenase